MSPLTIDEAAAEVEAAGRPCAELNGNGPGLESTCPCCGEGGVMTWRPHDPTWRCANGCDPSRIADELSSATARSWNERAEAGALQTEDARRELAAIYGLEPLGVKITGARIFGRGSRASADIYLSNGGEIVFASLRDAARPASLLAELAASVGATPSLKQPQALKAVTLLRRVAAHEAGFSQDEIARDWGTSYLQSTETLDLDMSDQAQRWGAFEALNKRDRAIVLRHHDGTRYVRCGWFRETVRGQDGTVSAVELAHRMERVGWLKGGKDGRIKATCKTRAGALVWTFYTVPAGWEDADR